MSSVFVKAGAVLMQTARSASTPVEVLRKLATHPDHNVHAALAGNPSTPSSVLDVIVDSGTGDLGTPRQLANHPNLSNRALRSLSKHRDAVVRCRVAGHLNVDRSTLKSLSNDENQIVRDTAISRMSGKHGKG